MENEKKGGLAEELASLRGKIEELPPAADEEQRQVATALNELMASLEKLSGTVERLGKETDK